MRHRRRALALLLAAAALLAAGWFLRRRAGIELEPESIRTWVDSLGWIAPAVYLGLVSFRGFLFMPSWMVLIAGGLCFGVVLGSLLGALGIGVSALVQFGLARGIGKEWVDERLSRRLKAWEHRLEGVEALAVGIATAHPLGPMSPFHVGAGLTAIPLAAFVLAIGIGAPVRAFAWAFFGEGLLDVGSPRFLAASAALALIILLPLGHPGFRARLFRPAPRPRGPDRLSR